MQLILVVKAIVFVDAKGGFGVCGPSKTFVCVFLLDGNLVVILFWFSPFCFDTKVVHLDACFQAFIETEVKINNIK